MVNFPVPIGGIPDRIDFSPSVLFATLHGLLVPLILYRILQRRGRSTLLIGTIVFSIERIVIYSLRAVQARSEERHFSESLITYMQVSFGLGYVGISNDLVSLLRCLLVNPTYGSERYEESPAAATKDCVMGPPPEGTPDMTRTRFWVRRFTDIVGILFLAATVTGAVANGTYYKGINNQTVADRVASVRIASGAVCLFLTLVLYAAICWAKTKLPRLSMRAVAVFTGLVTLIWIISVYRLVVMPIRVTSLDELSPLDSPGGKAAFYACHVLPEWIASLTLFAVNIRKTFGTGLAGDYRATDETEKQKMKRLAWEEKKREKKALTTKKTNELTDKTVV